MDVLRSQGEQGALELKCQELAQQLPLLGVWSVNKKSSKLKKKI